MGKGHRGQPLTLASPPGIWRALPGSSFLPLSFVLVLVLRTPFRSPPRPHFLPHTRVSPALGPSRLHPCAKSVSLRGPWKHCVSGWQSRTRLRGRPSPGPCPGGSQSRDTAQRQAQPWPVPRGVAEQGRGSEAGPALARAQGRGVAALEAGEAEARASAVSHGAGTRRLGPDCCCWADSELCLCFRASP